LSEELHNEDDLAAQFKVHCLRLINQVNSTRDPVLITKKGKPFAKLVPAGSNPDKMFGALRGKIKIVGDILSPVVPPEDWESCIDPTDTNESR
jgi:prevent-host-death family protein